MGASLHIYATDWKYWLWICRAQPSSPHFCWSGVTPFIHNLDWWDWCFFFTSSAQCPNMWNSTYISGVKRIL